VRGAWLKPILSLPLAPNLKVGVSHTSKSKQCLFKLDYLSVLN
jgi:hypothetical protein